MKRISYSYESPEEFLAALVTRGVNSSGVIGRRPGSENTDSYTKTWSGVGSYQEAIDKAMHGDPVVAEKIKPKDIHLSAHSALISTVYDTSGCTVDVGRYLSGDPECMGTRRKKGKPIINILVNVGACFGIDPEVMRNRGKSILEIMSGLESNGYGVQITLIAETRCGGLSEKLRYRVQVKIKGSGEYFNPVSLAYWLTCPSVLRRLNFRHREGEPTEIQDIIGSEYGATTNVDQEELDNMPDCVYFGAVESNDTGQYERAIEQIMETYKA